MATSSSACAAAGSGSLASTSSVAGGGATTSISGCGRDSSFEGSSRLLVHGTCSSAGEVGAAVEMNPKRAKQHVPHEVPDSDGGTSDGTCMELLCGKCRKKTLEPLSKQCQICAIPLHATCTRLVALHECHQTLDSPLGMAFCSKKCFDLANPTSEEPTVTSVAAATAAVAAAVGASAASLMQVQVVEQPQLHDNPNISDAQAASGSVQDLKPSKRLVPTTPNEITASLTVKIGDIRNTSRKQLSVTTFRFLVSEGFEVFRAKTNSRTLKELRTHSHTDAEPYIRDDMAIYIKPGMHSKQAELVELTDHNFEERIARSYRNFLKRRASSEGESYECDIVTYVKKKSSKRRHQSRQQQNALAGAVSNAGSSLSAAGALSSNTINSNNSSIGGTLKASKYPPQTSPPVSVLGANGLPSFVDYQDHANALEVVQSLNATNLSQVVSASSMLVVGANGAAVESPPILAGAPAPSLTPSTSVTNPLAKRKYSELGATESTNDPLDNGSGLNSVALDSGEYKSIRMILNGAVVSVRVNVRDLLAAFTSSTSGDQQHV